VAVPIGARRTGLPGVFALAGLALIAGRKARRPRRG
jgi:hypothetical protein